jgi:hypothetical protein
MPENLDFRQLIPPLHPERHIDFVRNRWPRRFHRLAAG